MKTMIQMGGRSLAGAICALAVVLIAFGASAQTSFEVNLDPTQEVPPHNTPAYGSADFTFNPGMMTLSVVANTGQYADLLGGATTVKIFDSNVPGSPQGTPGTFLFSLTLDTPGQTSGTFDGSGVLANMQQVTDLDAGDLYVNITDSVYPSGEIRGQLIAVPEPATMAQVGLGALALLACRRKWRSNR